MEDFGNDVSNTHVYKADTISIYPQYDTYINASEQNNNYGKSEVLVADME